MTRDLRTRAQLLSDLASSKLREQHAFDANARLEQRARAAEVALQVTIADRDDWKSAFKLIMRLVK